MGFIDFLLILFIFWFVDKLVPRDRRPMHEKSQEYLAGYYKDKGVGKI